MYKLFLLIFLISSSTFNSFSQTKLIEPNQYVSFKIKNAGLTVDGTIKGLIGTILFDNKNLSQSSLNVSLNATSVNTGNKTRDGHLQKDEYFDGAVHPKITFKSTKIDKTATGFVATGELTIKGVTKIIKLPFNYTENGAGGTFNGTVILDRRDFGVGGSSWIMGDDVSISISIKVLNQ